MSTKAALHPLPAFPSERTLARVQQAQAAHEEAWERLELAVRDARRDGHTWKNIGHALGTSAQAAHQRFSTQP
jgi:outer membrane protein TolC